MLIWLLMASPNSGHNLLPAQSSTPPDLFVLSLSQVPPIFGWGCRLNLTNDQSCYNGLLTYIGKWFNKKHLSCKWLIIYKYNFTPCLHKRRKYLSVYKSFMLTYWVKTCCFLSCCLTCCTNVCQLTKIVKMKYSHYF